jgi:hypothetical protein
MGTFFPRVSSLHEKVPSLELQAHGIDHAYRPIGTHGIVPTRKVHGGLPAVDRSVGVFFNFELLFCFWKNKLYMKSVSASIVSRCWSQLNVEYYGLADSLAWGYF